MSAIYSFAVPTTLTGLLILAAALIILWIVVSIPVYLGGELVTGGRADFGSAMGATLGGAIAYVVILWAGAYLLTPLVGPSALILAFVLAILVWLGVYRAAFDTGWLGALGIVLASWVVLVILDIVLTALFGVSFPKFYPF